MKLAISEARSCLGRLCSQVQDPREVIVFTRHEAPVAALVSVAEARRIWDPQDDEAEGPVSPLTGKRGGCLLPGFVTGVDGTPVTPKEAALQMREIQMTRKAEREVLAAGGLEPVVGDEVVVRQRGVRRWWQRLLRRR